MVEGHIWGLSEQRERSEAKPRTKLRMQGQGSLSLERRMSHSESPRPGDTCFCVLAKLGVLVSEALSAPT